jgi:hypothetical protein
MNNCFIEKNSLILSTKNVQNMYNKLICEAISSKKVIKFNYEGQERIVEPYTYGVHKDTNNEVLSAYQIGGFSSSGKKSLLAIISCF